MLSAMRKLNSAFTVMPAIAALTLAGSCAKPRANQSEPAESCLTVLETSWRADPSQGFQDKSVIVGRARNDCGYLLATASIEFNIFDSSAKENQVGSTIATTRSLAPGTTWAFTASVFEKIASSFKVAKVTALK
jgi:hypothetical protein